MIRNYLKVALRYLGRYRLYTVINLLGLTVGIASCLLMLLYVKSEFSYDRFHANAGRIFRVWQNEHFQGQDFTNTVTPLPMAAAIQNSFPEVEATSRVYAFGSLVKISGNSFNETLTMVDPGFFRMFDFTVRGYQDFRFPSANSIVITPAIAKKYFGDTDPVGKTCELKLSETFQLFTIAGIVNPPPAESSIQFDILIPYANEHLIFNERMSHSWFNVFNETYIMLRDRAQAALLQKKFPALLRQQLGNDYGTEQFDMYLQPLTNIHLNNSLPPGLQPVSNPKYAYILGTIAIVILLVACINFIILAVGRSTTRALEVGVRKTLGAARKQLVIQFWGEAMIVTCIAVLLGLVTAFGLVRPFGDLVNRHLSLGFDAGLGGFLVALVIIIGCLAGIYPAIILSGFKPIEVLKGKIQLRSNRAFFRKALVVAQFTASIVMIIGTIVIARQVKFIRHKDLGYRKDQVIVVSTNKRRAEGYALAKLFQAELAGRSEVVSSTASTFSFAETSWATLGFSDAKKTFHSFQYNEVDAAFTQTMQIPVVAGRPFEPGNTADTNNSILVNEAFVREYGLQQPVGKRFGAYSQQIIGVLKDFNYESLHEKIKPLVLSLKFDTIARQSDDVSFANEPLPRISVRMRAGDPAASVAILRDAWKLVAPDQEFDYRFLDETLAKSYQQEYRTAHIVSIASGMSIFIACMGLFGLATLTVSRRAKEVGIRRVLGATATQVVMLISTEFMILIAIASVIAFPIAWWGLQQWLTGFAYRAALGWWVFAAGAAAALLIGFGTIAVQALRAAAANPSNSIRTE